MRVSRLLKFWLLLLAPCAVLADSWVQPEIRTYTSQSGDYAFTVEPRLAGSQMFSFVQNSNGAGPVATDYEYPKGRLVSRAGNLLWERKLVNAVSPVSALVSAGGQFVVTFDNWNSGGIGPDVVVIYGSSGQVIRALSLGDIIGPQRASTLPRSISSRWWAGEHRFESEEILLLSVLAEGSDFRSGQPQFESIRIRLVDGAVMDQ